MARPKFNAGDAFAVPLRDGGYAVGVIARATKDRTLFGYFFGPRLESVPGVEILATLVASDAVLVGKFGHLGLTRGLTGADRGWPNLGRVPDWDAASWPLPSLVRPDMIRGGAFLATYDDANLLRERELEYFPPGVDVEGPGDGLMGAGFVEIRLTRLLSELEA